MTLPYIPKLVQWCFPKRIWHLSRSKKTIYLTFDDGPIPEVTLWVLEQLKSYNAKATFFCIGENIVKHPDLFNQIALEGHTIGNHTQHHLNFNQTKLSEYIKDVEQCENTISTTLKKENDTVIKTQKLFRPPYGKLSFKASKKIKNLGHKIIMWDVLSVDYSAAVSKSKCLTNVLNHTKNGSIIAFHDSLKAEKNLRYVLPKVLEKYSERGYKFNRL
jgi:peptidoglycan/xylan/chitin deacetylase (PgdA/CDA1 family)